MSWLWLIPAVVRSHFGWVSCRTSPDGSSISYREKGFAEIKRMNKHQVRSIGATIENMNKRKRT